MAPPKVDLAPFMVASRIKTDGSYRRAPRVDPEVTQYSNKVDGEFATIDLATKWILENGIKCKLYAIYSKAPAYIGKHTVIAEDDPRNGGNGWLIVRRLCHKYGEWCALGPISNCPLNLIDGRVVRAVRAQKYRIDDWW